MKHQLFLLPSLLALLMTLSGCNPDSPFGVMFSPPTCGIVNTQKFDASFPTPATIRMTVKNTGDATAYDVACEITLKCGDTIVDEDAVYFGTLASNESYAQDAWFWNITSHSEYTSADYFLYWFDSQGDYHDLSKAAPSGQMVGVAKTHGAGAISQ
jgi:hypothetical protein